MNPERSPLELRLLSLLQRVRDERAADARAELNTLLRTNADARQVMATSLVNEQAIIHHLRDESIVCILKPETTATVSTKSLHWFQGRPLWAAAAGIVFGMFCTSVMFGYVMPGSTMTRQRSVSLFTESFEGAQPAPERGFPTKAGAWFGSLASAIAPEGAVKAKDGRSMMRLSAAPSQRRKFSYAYRVVDLAGYPMPADAESRLMEVTAFFHGDGIADSDRYQIRLAAFSEEPGELRPIWNDEATLFDRVLQHVGRTEIPKPGERDWKSVRAIIEIPPGARSLVISLGAAMADEFAPRRDHYLDDVRARFIINEGPR